jgi:glyoxalase family protein
MGTELSGIHHLTAVTARARDNKRFYTQTLGLRLVKKTVNQDDVSSYHLFYADKAGSPGTDMTFFDWPVARERRGTRSIVRTGLRVGSEASLAWWHDRLAGERLAVTAPSVIGGRPTLLVEDEEGQRLALVVDPDGPAGEVWEKSPVPAEHQIHGLGPITLSVPAIDRLSALLVEGLGMREAGQYEAPEIATGPIHVFAMGAGGPAAELHVAVEPAKAPAMPGAGGVHHVAFRARDGAELTHWAGRLREGRIATSGEVERYYFRSLYFREPNGILFEIATDGPGFSADEPVEALGERLALPPFLEGRRAEIEAGLKPF